MIKTIIREIKTSFGRYLAILAIGNDQGITFLCERDGGLCFLIREDQYGGIVEVDRIGKIRNKPVAIHGQSV